MSKTNDGGPAFPHQGERRGLQDQAYMQDGMSLRDYFAGQALCGLLAFPHPSGEGEPPARHTAAFAYEHADAMLAARKGRPYTARHPTPETTGRPTAEAQGRPRAVGELRPVDRPA